MDITYVFNAYIKCLNIKFNTNILSILKHSNTYEHMLYEHRDRIKLKKFAFTSNLLTCNCPQIFTETVYIVALCILFLEAIRFEKRF